MFLSFDIYNLFMIKKLFITIESLLYITFIIMDFLDINSTLIKYIGVILCFVYALYSKKKLKSVALLFTCLADLFLLVLLKHYELGVFIFIFAQVTYLYYLRNIDVRISNYILVFRILIIVVGTIILYFSNNFSLLYELVLIYFSTLLFNCLNAFKVKEKTFALGLILFIGCDICVGLFNTPYSDSVIAMLIWMFYLPSQVLIVLS
jgi:uncharacterized membrane protein YhhN